MNLPTLGAWSGDTGRSWCRSSLLTRYGVGVAIVGAALLIRWALEPVLAGSSPYLTSYLAVMATAVWCGTGSALLATFLSALIGNLFFLPPLGELNTGPAELVRLAVMLLSNIAIAVMAGMVQKSHEKSKHETEAARKAEKAMRDTEQRFRALVEAAAQIVWTRDERGEVYEDSPSWRAFTGQSVEEWLSSRWVEAIHPDDRDIVSKEWGNSLRTTSPFHLEYRLRHHSGVYRWVLARAVPLRDADGNLKGWVGMSTDITGGKEAERELDRMRRIMAEGERIAHVGCFEYVAATQETIWSDEECRIYGLEPGARSPAYETLLDKHIHPDDAMRVNEVFTAAMDNRSVYEQEHRVVRPDGSVRWVHNRAHPYFDADGVLIRYVGATLDITDRKMSEFELGRKETELREAQRLAHLGSWYWDSKSDALTASEELLRIYGFNTEIEAPPRFKDQRGRWYSVSQWELLNEAMQRALATGEPYEMDVRGVRDREPIWVTTRGEAVRASDGSISGLRGTVQDITERKQAEENLRESESRFRTLADNMAQLAWMADATGRIFWYNQRWYEYTGTRLEQMQGSNWKHVLHPDYMESVTEKLGRCLQTGEVWEDTFPLRAQENNYRWFLSRAIPIKGNQGDVIRWFGTHTDVTVQRRTEEQLGAAKRAAEEASRAKDHFLAVLSHELRTPLSPVITAVSILKSRHLDPETRNSLDLISRNVELEATLIDDLLDVTRISRGKIELHRKPVDVATLIEQAIEVVKPESDERQLSLQVGTDRGAHIVNADATRLQQVFWNLLRNAIKFTPHGGSIDVSCRVKEGDRVEVEVRDNGQGIAPEALPRIFNAFEQAEQSITRQFGGLGLGLTISKALVELHGGSIAAYSEGKGRGASFRVQLPLIDAMPIHEERLHRSVSSGRSLRILLVEDHEDSAQMMRTLLEMEGHGVRQAESVATALNLVEDQVFDLLISDLGLPDRSGLELMQEIRTRGLALPGIALSGYGREDDVRKCKEAGFTAHLTKPASPIRLVEVIASLCG